MAALMGGFSLPYSVDFTALPDGALPSVFRGATWAISGGVAVNTPIYIGDEMLIDPGLEANYTSGLCDSLRKSGSPTVSEETSDMHGGSHAQVFTAAAAGNAIYWPVVFGVSGAWYQFSAWCKRTAGATNNCFLSAYQAYSLPNSSGIAKSLESSEWEQITLSYLSTTTDYMFRRVLANDTENTIILDDGSCKRVNPESLFCILPESTADVVVKLKLDTLSDATLVGIVLRADARTDPSNYIAVLWKAHGSEATYGEVYVIKRIGSTYTGVLGYTSTGVRTAGAWLEVRASGSTVQVFYNDIQRGADLTISDAELLTNRYHGMISVGSNRVTDFFVSAS